ncbi:MULTISPECIES: fused MFS/spermidine synthase [Sphingomonas]|uniref:Fused MFS/spermidine synthase n=1 Tax=Sphingomonas molluscorum TaxID=418184 RepID=A0ABU8Q506_9SPHN|nr:SAM-dependent methyltransferase [Sphingomonas sp. JUb134]
MTQPAFPRPGPARALFALTILTGSFLLFLVQPMVARMALPRLGGAPAVWNSAMLVYQALLLGGYAYAHWLAHRRPRTQALTHLSVLALAALWLPIGLSAMRLRAGAEPGLWVPWLLGASIGPLFFAVSAQAPLMQRWYSTATGGRDPYALYAASNVGSFAGLLAYPLLVEPKLALAGQSWLWTGGYLFLVLLVLACALLLPRSGPAAHRPPLTSPAPTRGRLWWWIALAFVPSGLMIETSSYLTTDIVAVPLLWVLPLGLYLLSFTVAFAARRGLANFLTRYAPVAVLVFGTMVIAGHHGNAAANAAVALLLLFVVSVALHSCMYENRPAPERLTGFYLAMSVGGALGGVFAGLVAPVLFDWTYEFPLLILAAGVLVPQHFLLPITAQLWGEGRARRRIIAAAMLAVTAFAVWLGLDHQAGLSGGARQGVVFVALALLGLFAIGVRPVFAGVLAGALFLFGVYDALRLSAVPGARTRSYFGVYTITERPEARDLAHGTTLHGVQLLGSEARLRQPTTYYVPGSGVGQAMRALPTLFGSHARVGVVGLGTGTLACYARPGQRWRFYEIDPAVVRIASDPRRFSFLDRCLPGADIKLGDARLSLADERSSDLDLLVLDAFTSDAVPLHLMTREAFETYARVLAPGGLLLLHTSNRYLAMEQVVAATVAGTGWKAAAFDYFPTDDEAGQEATASEWIVLGRGDSFGRLVRSDAGWRALRREPGLAPWTDDYASIVPVLRGVTIDAN